MTERVYLEIGNKKVFAGCVRWPGWGRFAKTEEAALDALADYLPRYAVVVKAAGLSLARTADRFEVVERVKGDASTEFGVPGQLIELDHEPVKPAEAKRSAALLTAAWKVFDRVAAKTPEELRKGPRGGGRDRDKMVDHVLQAEAGYARRVGVKLKIESNEDSAGIAALRSALLDVLGTRSDGTAPVERGWPPRYAVRRIAWHVLDHVWEMEDRSS